MNQNHKLLARLSWMTVIVCCGSVSGQKSCVVPEPPDGGKFDNFRGWPGDLKDVNSVMEINCRENYTLVGSKFIKCLADGSWDSQPECKRKCRLSTSRTIDVSCSFNEKEVDCGEPQNHGAVVTPSCKPGHFNVNIFSNKCNDGWWTYNMPSCSPTCGELPGIGVGLVLNGKVAPRGLFPWHAVVYKIGGDDPSGYTQICGGTIVSNYYVISAAHCFYDDNTQKVNSPEIYLVGLGKSMRTAGDEIDSPYIQNIDVSKIIIQDTYRGDSRNHQSDIALLELDREIKFTQFVLPICMSYDKSAERSFFSQRASLARVPGMGLTSEGGNASNKLMYIDVPVIDRNRCSAEMPESFQKYLTNDKICAGYLNGTGVCNGDSGGGLVFKSNVHSMNKWFLLGIVSTGVPSDSLGPSSCKSNTYSTFTQVSDYVEWIKQNIDRLVIVKSSPPVTTEPPTSLSLKYKYSENEELESVGVEKLTWLAEIFYKNNITEDIYSRCNGVLISRRLVLSAAQCFHPTMVLDSQPIRVKLYSENGDAVLIPIERIIPHRDYKKKNRFECDIAVIMLKNDASQLDLLKPINLPKTDRTSDSPAPKFALYMVNATKFQFEGFKSALRLELPFVENDVCLAAYQGAQLMLSDKLMCAGGQGIGLCHGSSGAPLVDVVDDEQFLVGINIFGAPRCGSKPDVFTKVFSHLGWIEDKIKRYH